MQNLQFAKLSISISPTKQPVQYTLSAMCCPRSLICQLRTFRHTELLATTLSDILSLSFKNQLLLFSTRHFAKLQQLVLLAPVSPNSSDLHSFLPGHLPQNLQQLGNYFEQLGNYFEQLDNYLNN